MVYNGQNDNSTETHLMSWYTAASIGQVGHGGTEHLHGSSYLTASCPRSSGVGMGSDRNQHE